MPVWKVSIRSLSRKEMQIARKWLLVAYQQCIASGDSTGAAEIQEVGSRIRYILDSINQAEKEPAEIIEW